MNRLFWGLFFVVLDCQVKLGSAKIGLLPDFIGWYLLMKGMEALAEENRYFDRSRHWAFGLTLANLVLYGADLLELSSMSNVALWAVKLAGICVGLYVLRGMIRGIRHLETDHAWDLQTEKLQGMWMIQAVMCVIAHLFSWLPLISSFTTAASTVTALCMLVAMYVTMKRFKEREK